MKKLIVYVLVVSCIGLNLSVAFAGDCYSDMVVRRWVEERDRAEERVVQAWAKGASSEQFAPGVAIILSNEFYICSKCRDDREFLKQKLHILNKGTDAKVETVPAMILEQLIGEQILSPWRQFPSDRRKGVAKR